MAKIPLPTLSDYDNDEASFNVLLRETSAHAAIVVVASYIDASLAVLLQHRFLKSDTAKQLLDPVRGTLGTFNARASLCYVLGLLSKETFQDMTTIAEMRNYCAHDPKIKTWDDSEIQRLFAKITYADRAYGKGALDDMDPFLRFKSMSLGISNEAYYVARRIPHAEPMNLSEFVRLYGDKILSE